MPLATADAPDPRTVLAKAVLRAGRALGLTQADVGRVIGRDRTSITRGLDPATKPGELALLLVRCYRGLHALTGGRREDMQHWMHTPNMHTGGVPADQITSVAGLVRVVEYLDAIRARP